MNSPNVSRHSTCSLARFAALLGVAVLAADAASAAQRPVRSRKGAARPVATAVPDRTQTVDLRTVALNAPIAFQEQMDPEPLAVDVDSPFREAETMLLDRQELGIFVTSTVPGYLLGDSSVILDDPGEDDGELPGSFDPFSFGHTVLDAVSADVDKDGRDEMLVLTRDGELFRVDVAPNGQSSWQVMAHPNLFFVSGEMNGSLTVGDFDGDRRDEVAIFRTAGPLTGAANTSSVWIFDDAEDGAGLLWERHFAQTDEFGGYNSYSGIAADLDEDGDSELILQRQGQAGSKGWVRFTMLDWNNDSSGFLTRVYKQLVFQNSLPTLGTQMTSRGAAGQFDDDSADEVVLYSTWPSSTTRASLTLDQYNYNVASERFDFVERANFSGDHVITPNAETAIDVCAFDRDGDGKDWIGVVSKPVNAVTRVRALRFNTATDSWVSNSLPSTMPFADGAICIAPGDSNSDRKEELYVGYVLGTIARVERLYGRNGTPSDRLPFTDIANSLNGLSTRVILAPGEYDGDGLRVRYQGSTVRLSNPVPLTLMVAVPTKAGISQNYSNSGTGYSEGTSTGISTSYTSSTTISAAAGFEFEEFTGTFGGSVKATMDRESSSTSTNSSLLTEVVGYHSSHFEDVIVFASNQYLVHEFLIVRAPDPDAVGETFFIDVPLDTDVLKWEVSYYNERVPAQYRITSELLPHTIGQPESYRSFSEMASLTANRVSWSGSTISVGQGIGGSISTAIDLSTEQTQTEQTSLALGTSASFKAWGVTAEASISFGNGSAYSVTTSDQTVYSGQIGDIPASDYSTWAYQIGICVYQPWRQAINNLPVGGWPTGTYPLTVIDFWTNPFGSGY